MTQKCAGTKITMYADLVLIIGILLAIIIAGLLGLCFTKSSGANTKFARKDYKQQTHKVRTRHKDIRSAKLGTSNYVSRWTLNLKYLFYV